VAQYDGVGKTHVFPAPFLMAVDLNVDVEITDKYNIHNVKN
jgi:hypothetical protein